MNIPSQDQNFQNGMKDYILHHFSDLLGEHVGLLDESDGIEQLLHMMQKGELTQS